MSQTVLSVPHGERRSTLLLQRDPAVIGQLLVHSIQLRICSVVENLLTRLRSLHAWRDYYEFQRILFSHVFEAEQALAEASRNRKRLQRGRWVPEAPSGDWRLEQAVLDRAVRQFRSVGDALAFGQLDHRRGSGGRVPHHSPSDVADLQAFFRVCAERGLGLVGSW